MNPRRRCASAWSKSCGSLALLWSILLGTPGPAAQTGPNVVVIYADDMGYADLGVQGNQQVQTPHIDSLAANGVRFSNSYVTGCVCSPSRAGLMTGRYQQRFGFDANAEGGDAKKDRAVRGLDLQQITFAQHMKQLGYATGLVGKWHLGASEGYLPTQRGFDEFYGLLPHGIGAAKQGEQVPIYRGTQQVDVPADHTVAFGREARAYIERHATQPFFLYLAFTAVHSPHVAPDSYLEKYAAIEPKGRRHYLAMLACMDDAVGEVLAALRSHKLEERTLIFFASDNGGPGNAAVVHNDPFRGGKWSLWEGGVRSPILVQWKGHIPGARVLPQMTNQLDWLPTAVAAAGGTIRPEWKLDGANLLPLLEGQTTAPVHDALYWRFGVQYAVREGDWKLVKPSLEDAPKLFNLADDPGEANDLAAAQPERVKQLQALWDAWNAQNEPPRWIDQRWNGLEAKGVAKKAKKAQRPKPNKRG